MPLGWVVNLSGTGDHIVCLRFYNVSQVNEGNKVMLDYTATYQAAQMMMCSVSTLAALKSQTEHHHIFLSAGVQCKCKWMSLLQPAATGRNP